MSCFQERRGWSIQQHIRGMTLTEKLQLELIDVNDFPYPGILFKDITPLFLKPFLVQELAEDVARQFNGKVDAVCGLESRGFLLGMPIAIALGVPFVLIRKAGKLPRDVYRVSYELEYGSAAIEMHRDAIAKGARILIHDDVLATGGTAAAAADLVNMTGAQLCGFHFIVEIESLHGRERLQRFTESVHSFVRC
jgi:adenine phosphoribosyltransferase